VGHRGIASPPARRNARRRGRGSGLPRCQRIVTWSETRSHFASRNGLAPRPLIFDQLVASLTLTWIKSFILHLNRTIALYRTILILSSLTMSSPSFRLTTPRLWGGSMRHPQSICCVVSSHLPANLPLQGNGSTCMKNLSMRDGSFRAGWFGEAFRYCVFDVHHDESPQP